MDINTEKVRALEHGISQPGFWNNQQKANETVQELKSIRSTLQPYLELEKIFKETEELITIVEPGDANSIVHVNEDVKKIEAAMAGLEFRSLLSSSDDKSSAILSINSGAGGTEACDWAAMIARMYSKWSQDKGYGVQQLDFLPGEGAGVKNCTFIIKGEYAYGYLKSEIGVHRLVRISPFDSNKRRHTSFASVDVIPEVTDDIKIEINEKDLLIDTYRSGGKGGQHANKTDSAVRIMHIPTGIVVQCQNERSQFKNKAMAMKVLKAKLYEAEKKKKDDEQVKQYEAKQRIEWGSQIRSYVFQPYSMVKDHRTDYETSDVNGVMDGKLGDFMQAYLKWTALNKNDAKKK